MLLLSNADVADLFTLEEAIDIAESVYREQGNGAVVALPRQALVSRLSHVSIAGGALDDSGVLAVRMSVSTHDDQTHEAALLFDSHSGELLSVMPYGFSPSRTAGMAGLATKILSPPSASILCMVGTGRRAFDYLRVACLVRPITEIRVFSRNETNRSNFAKQMQAELDLPVISASSFDAATSGADIIYVSTNSRVPVMTSATLDLEDGRGIFIASMGRVPELDESLYLSANDIFVSDKNRVLLHRAGDDASECQLCVLVASSGINADKLHELGSVLSGEISPASHNDGMTLFKDFAGGSGFGDVALSLETYRRCLNEKRGISFAIH